MRKFPPGLRRAGSPAAGTLTLRSEAKSSATGPEKYPAEKAAFGLCRLDFGRELSGLGVMTTPPDPADLSTESVVSCLLPSSSLLSC